MRIWLRSFRTGAWTALAVLACFTASAHGSTVWEDRFDDASTTIIYAADGASQGLLRTLTLSSDGDAVAAVTNNMYGVRFMDSATEGTATIAWSNAQGLPTDLSDGE